MVVGVSAVSVLTLLLNSGFMAVGPSAVGVFILLLNNYVRKFKKMQTTQCKSQ